MPPQSLLAIGSPPRLGRSGALIGDEMALKTEGIVDGGMHAEEALGGSSRFEPLHLTFSPSHRVMRIPGAIVLPEPLFVRAGQPQTPESRGVRAQLGHQQLQDEALLLEQLAHQPQRRPAVARRCTRYHSTGAAHAILGGFPRRPGKPTRTTNTYS